MKTLPLLLLFFLLAVQAPAQDRLAAASGLGASGPVCDPWSCTPAPVEALRGTTLQLLAQGSAFAPRFLLVSLAPAQCASLPGISGALIVQPSAIITFQPLFWRRVYVSPGPGSTACGGWTGFGNLALPTGVPAGLTFLVQTLSVAEPTPGAVALNLSTAVEVTLR